MPVEKFRPLPRPPRIVSLLIAAFFPRRFRETFAMEMLEVFESRRRDARRRGRPALASFWIRACWNLMVNGIGEHFRSSLTPASRPSPKPKGNTMWIGLSTDLRVALRSLTKRPGFTLGVVATLALGIGANTAVFSVLNGVVLRPLPFEDPDSIVSIKATGSSTSSLSYFDLKDWQDGAKTLESVAGFCETDGVLAMESRQAVHVRGMRVSRELFGLLRSQPLSGRVFTADEDREGGPRAVVLGYGLWQSVFGGREDVVGQVVAYEGESYLVAGIMPSDFAFPDSSTQLWFALRGNELLRNAGIRNPSRGLSFISIVARRREGVSLEAAQAEVGKLDRRLREEHSLDTRRIDMSLLKDSLVGGLSSRLTLILLATGLILLIACANVCNLVLARTAARQRETGMRAALGAGRWPLMRPLLAEGLLLSVCGAAMGLLLGWGVLSWLLSQQSLLMVRKEDISLGTLEFGFAAMASVLCALVIGTIPAWSSSRADLSRLLQDGTRGGSGSKRVRRLQQFLSVPQIAMAVVLVIGAGLLTRSFFLLTSEPKGFDSENLLTFSVYLPTEKYSNPVSVLDFYARLSDEIEALPKVQSASVSNSLPFEGNDFRQSIRVEGQESDSSPEDWVTTTIVEPGYFRNLGVPLVEGRDISSEDRWGGPPVAIVNRSMAERFWPGETAVGKRFRRDGGVTGAIDTLRYFSGRPWITVVGVSGDERREGYSQAAGPAFYIPHSQMPWNAMSLAVRTAGDPLDLVAPIRQRLARLDSQLAPIRLATLGDTVSRSVFGHRFRAQLIGLFALLAGLLAVVGVYSVLSFSVTQRVREIGIRLALGARRRVVVGMVLSQGLLLALIGIGLGVAASWAFSHWMASLLYGVAQFDPWTYALAVALVLSAAAVACYLPARRASRIPLLDALRSE